jgi:hypothetical protein
MRSLDFICLTTLWVSVSCFAQEGSAVVRTPIKLDPKHSPRIGTAYYPPQSLKNLEQGTCHVAVLVDADGSVSAMQLLFFFFSHRVWLRLGARWYWCGPGDGASPNPRRARLRA